MSEKFGKYLELMVEAALACVAHRVSLKLSNTDGFCPKHNAIANTAIDALQKLARFCRLNGRDARESPLYASFGPLASRYEDRFEFRRRVECDILTPAAIDQAVDKGNTLVWKDWTISCSRPQELTDAYGQFAWGPIVYANSESGARHEYELPGQATYRARLIFKDVTGSDFEGDDGLKDDLPHVLEHGYCESHYWP